MEPDGEEGVESSGGVVALGILRPGTPVCPSCLYLALWPWVEDFILCLMASISRVHLDQMISEVASTSERLLI